MIKFIKNLLGFGSAGPAKTQETVREILTPPADLVVATAKGNVPLANSTSNYIPPAKPVRKIRAGGAPVAEVSVTGSNTIAKKTVVAPKPASKPRRPYRGKNPKAKTGN